MKYQYEGFDQRGKPVSGAVESPDESHARESLRRDGIYVDSIRQVRLEDLDHRKKTNARDGHIPRLGGGQRLSVLAAFMRQLSILIATGTPLVDAIASLERQERDVAFRAVIKDILSKLEQGSTFSEAVAGHPAYFSGVARSLISAGEQGGQFDQMLGRIARLARQQEKIRSTVAGAMIYPALLISVSIGVLCAMLFFVLPRFEGLFKTLGTPLPTMTRVLMAMSGFLRENWVVCAGVVVCSVAAIVLMSTTQRGRAAIQAGAMKMPVIGSAMRALSTARVARVLGVLLEGKVQMIDALHLTRDAAGSPHYAALITRAEDSVLRGDTVSAAWEGSVLVPPSVVEAVRSGERTGRVGTVLLSLAEHMDEDNELAIKTATHIIEPVILIVLGLIVGAMAISMFLPLFDLTAAGSGGPVP